MSNGSSLFDAVDYRISVVVMPVIFGDPNIDYADLNAYLMYRMVQFTLDAVVEYQKGARVPDSFPCKECPPEPNGNGFLYRAKVIAYALNVRSGPSSVHGVIGHVKEDDVLDIWEVNSGWGRIDEEKERWVYLRYTRQL